MKVNYLTLLAGATLALLTAAAARAEESAAAALAAENSAAPASTLTTTSTSTSTTMLATTSMEAGDAPVTYFGKDGASYYEDSDPVQDFIARAGVWAVHSSGSQTEVGQYQNVRQSSPFFNIDGIKSDGERTVDLSIQGNDNDTDDARLHYFGPHVEANIDYERFDHQLYQDSYAGWATIAAGSTASSSLYNVGTRDNLNPGQDYAMRVQEFKADFKGNLTDNLKWYVNTFGLEKTGTRQANTVSHCFPSNTVPAGGASYNGTTYASGPGTSGQCHAVSQAQRIDWQTTEVEPGIELKLGQLTVNYSHMIRDFRADDGMSLSLYNTNSSGFAAPTYATPPGAITKGFTVAGNNIVPNSLTQMDRLKAHADVGYDTDIYAMGYAGNTEDELNQMSRNCDGGDLRITNRSIHNLTVTGFARAYSEHTNLQGESLSSLYPSLAYFYQQPQSVVPLYTTPSATVPPVIDRDREAVGVNTRWLPFGDDGNWVQRHFAVTGGYEYGTEHYQQTSGGGTVPNTLTYVTGYGTKTFTQPDTIKNTLSIGLEEKWSDNLQTYVRYKWIGTLYPFIGVTPAVDNSAEAALNTALPTTENRVEIGGTWTANDSFMLNATVFLETSSCNLGFAQGPTGSPNFNSNSFPFVLSAWWAATAQWSFNAGFAEMDSWIDQQVVQSVLGSTTPTPYFIPATFNNRSNMFNVGTRYAWTERFSTCGSAEYVYATNETSIPVPYTGGPYNLGGFSLVQSTAVRLSVGADYLLRPGVTTFARYNFYNFQDLTPVPATGAGSGATNTNMSGQTNMFLVGASAKF